MPPTLDREKWCLWASDGPEWHLMDTNTQPEARHILEQKAASLRLLFTNRKFVVVYGVDKPGTKRF